MLWPKSVLLDRKQPLGFGKRAFLVGKKSPCVRACIIKKMQLLDCLLFFCVLCTLVDKYTLLYG